MSKGPRARLAVSGPALKSMFWLVPVDHGCVTMLPRVASQVVRDLENER